LARPGFASQRTRRLRMAAGAGVSFAVLVMPWRVWTAAHHLSDSIEPRIPHALDPAYIFSRTRQLNETITSMARQTSSEWHWALAVFIAACVTCMAARIARRM